MEKVPEGVTAPPALIRTASPISGPISGPGLSLPSPTIALSELWWPLPHPRKDSPACKPGPGCTFQQVRTDTSRHLLPPHSLEPKLLLQGPCTQAPQLSCTAQHGTAPFPVGRWSPVFPLPETPEIRRAGERGSALPPNPYQALQKHFQPG